MRKVLPLSVALAVLCTGCATLQQLLASSLQTPTLTFKSAHVSDVSLASATINLEYELHNPNPYGLSLASVEYALFVEGKQVVAGSPPRGLTIPASGRSEVVFPASVRFADVAPVIQVFLEKDVASYRAQGSVGVETPIGIVSLPFEKEGTFPVPKAPEVAMQQPRVTRITFTSATLELPLLVTNKNDFALPISGLSGAVTISGARVGTVASPDLGSLPPKAQVPVNLPVTIDFVQAANAAAALQRGQATVAFDAELRSGTMALPVHLEQTVSFRR